MNRIQCPACEQGVEAYKTKVGEVSRLCEKHATELNEKLNGIVSAGAGAASAHPQTSNLDTDELKEKLAEIEHERWADWQKWMHSKLHKFPNQIILIRSDYEHWERQIATQYKDLSEPEKNSDREQVDRYWPLIQAYVTQECIRARIQQMEELNLYYLMHDGEGEHKLAAQFDVIIDELTKSLEGGE
jgi:hypothetical protein